MERVWHLCCSLVLTLHQVSGHQLDLHVAVAVHNIRIRAIMVVEVGVMSEAIMMVADVVAPSKSD